MRTHVPKEKNCLSLWESERRRIFFFFCFFQWKNAKNNEDAKTCIWRPLAFALINQKQERSYYSRFFFSMWRVMTPSESLPSGIHWCHNFPLLTRSRPQVEVHIWETKFVLKVILCNDMQLSNTVVSTRSRFFVLWFTILFPQYLISHTLWCFIIKTFMLFLLIVIFIWCEYPFPSYILHFTGLNLSLVC